MLTQTLAYAAGALASVGVAAAVAQRCALSRGPERRNWNGSVFGHRGCRFVPGVVENTIPAYEYALNKGADGIEIDVRLCRTGELVVFHDDYTTPACDGPRRRIIDMTFEEVQSLRYRDDPTRTVRPPLVEEVLQLCIRRGCKLLFELKEYSWAGNARLASAAVVRLAERYKDFFETKCTIISFNPLALYLIRRANSQLAVGPLYDDKTITGIAKGGCDAKGSWWVWLLCPSLLDRVFASSIDTWASYVMGASMTCTRVDLCDAAKAIRHASKGRLVYLYGLVGSVPSHLQFVQATIACDDDHDKLKASIV